MSGFNTVQGQWLSQYEHFQGSKYKSKLDGLCVQIKKRNNLFERATQSNDESEEDSDEDYTFDLLDAIFEAFRR